MNCNKFNKFKNILVNLSTINYHFCTLCYKLILLTLYQSANSNTNLFTMSKTC